MKFLNLALVLAAGVFSLAGKEYFVSNSGNDRNPGTKEQPFLTIRKGADVARAGDTVTVRGGIYHEMVDLRRYSGEPGKPITFRGAPGETAVISDAFPVKNWKKVPNLRFSYVSSTPYAVNILYETRRFNRYFGVASLDVLDRKPGTYMQDKKSGKLYIHALKGEDPNGLGIVVNPYRQYGKLLPFSAKTDGLYQWDKGIMLYVSNIIIDNFVMAFWPGQAIRANPKCRNISIRNNTVFGGTCGLMYYGGVQDSDFTNNTIYGVAGIGAEFTGAGKNLVMRGNFLKNNGSCIPFREAPDGSEGAVYNIAHYGSCEVGHFLDNTVISTDFLRCGGDLMRCKGGIRKHTHQKGNVFYGGGISLYPAWGDGKVHTALVENNTTWGGAGRYAVGFSQGKYNPVFKNNLESAKTKVKDPCFADPFHCDFRLRADSPCLGMGAFPEAGNLFYVKPGASGTGISPAQAGSLEQALKRVNNKKELTIYLLKGTYTVKAKFDGKVKLANYAGEPVILKDSKISGDGEMTVTGILFRNGKLDLDGKAVFRRCAFDSAKVEADKILCDKSTFAAVAVLSADELTLRNSLVDGNAVKIGAKKCLSENNAFTSATLLEKWQKAHAEAHKSFAASVKLDEFCRTPADSFLSCAALDGLDIGGRALPLTPPKFAAEELTITPVSPDSVRMEWYTPFDYCELTIRGYELGSNPTKYVAPAGIKQGLFNNPDGVHYLRNLVPGKKYRVTYYFYRQGSKKYIPKTLDFTMPLRYQHTPRTLKVDASGKGEFKTISAAVKAARGGDTILVAPGHYSDSVVIGVNDLTIKAAVPGSVEWDSSKIFDYAILLAQTDKVTIEGFYFTGLRYSASASVINLGASKNSVIRNCRFDREWPNHCSNNSIVAHKADGILVENCFFDMGFQGLWTIEVKNLVVRNNTFYGQGINGVHAGCLPDGRVEIYNNVFMDTVSNHSSPAVSVAWHGKHIYCDYNLYWKTNTNQRCYGFGHHNESPWYSATWHVQQQNQAHTTKAAFKRFGVEKHGFEADPLFVNAAKADYRLKPGTPTKGRGRDGANIGADWSVFKFAK